MTSLDRTPYACRRRLKTSVLKILTLGDALTEVGNLFHTFILCTKKKFLIIPKNS